MDIDTNCPRSPLSLGSETDPAHRATEDESRQEGAKQISELRGDAHDSHVAEHIRGMVAATMASITSQASEASRNHAEHWQQWALGIAAGLEVVTTKVGLAYSPSAT